MLTVQSSVIYAVMIVFSILLKRCADSQLIPRMFLFNNPKYSSVSVSPDGKNIAYLAANGFGISNVFVRCIGCKYALPVTFENRHHVTGYQWTGVPNIILYYQDNNGDENFRLFKANITNASSFVCEFIHSSNTLITILRFRLRAKTQT